MYPAGTLRVFRQFAWLEVGSVKAASSRPAHPRVTKTIGPLSLKLSYLLKITVSLLRGLGLRQVPITKKA